MEIAFLVKHKSEPDVLQGLPAKIKAMAMGSIPHAEPVLTALYQRIVQTPSQTDPVAIVEPKLRSDPVATVAIVEPKLRSDPVATVAIVEPKLRSRPRVF